MHALSERHAYRYLNDASQVYIPTMAYQARRKLEARFLTARYDRVPQGVVLCATLFHQECQDLCLTQAGASVLPMSLPDAKDLCAEFRIPLLVTVGARCDLATRDAQYEFFLYQPADFKFFGSRKKEC
jgi:hypothetical protein